MKNKYYPHLFEKGKIGNVVIKNRIVRNSMGTYLGNPDGTVTVSLFKCLSTTKNWDNSMFKYVMHLEIKRCLAFIKVHSSF